MCIYRQKLTGDDMRTALYVRVSTEEQAKQGNSLEEQEERGRAYCKAMGWQSPQVFIDDGYSAKDLNRKNLQRLLESVKDFDVIITTKLDRLSRKLSDILSIVEFFEKHSVAYASVSESFDTSTAAGKLTLQVLGAVAEFERERNRERVQENLRSLARKNRLIGKAAYGYEVVDGEYRINVEESLIVRKIFDWFLNESLGPLAISAKLNQLGIPSKGGKAWTEGRIRDLMKLEALTGTFIYNRKYRKGKSQIKRPSEEWIVVEDHHQPIISKEMFERANQILYARKTGARKHFSSDSYLLSGLVVCVHCGGKMVGRTVRKNLNQNRKVYHKYLCEGYNKRGNCFHHFVHRDEIEELVLSNWKRISDADPNEVEYFRAEPVDIVEKDLLKNKLEKIESRWQKQIEAYENELITADDLKKARTRLEKEREELIRSIAAHENRVFESYVETDNRLELKRALAQLVKRIEVKDGKEISIIWKA